MSDVVCELCGLPLNPTPQGYVCQDVAGCGAFYSPRDYAHMYTICILATKINEAVGLLEDASSWELNTELHVAIKTFLREVQ